MSKKITYQEYGDTKTEIIDKYGDKIKMTFEQKCELSSQFYFNIVHSLGIEDECIRKVVNGTENTEKGRNLYYAIEDFLENMFGEIYD